MPQQFVQNPLEQFETESLPIGWPWRFLAVSFIIFSATAFVYAGMVFGYEPYLNNKIAEQDQAIGQLAESVSADERDQFARFYSQIVNLKNLLDNHVAGSTVFPFLESVTNKRVYYTAANLKTAERGLELDGVAADYQVLSEQLESFKRSSLVSGYSLNQSQLSSDSNVQFKVVVKLKEAALK